MQEVTKLLLQARNITSGHYISHISPNIKGTIVNINEDGSKDEYRQAMIVAFDAIELIEVPKDTPTAIDASK